MILAVYCAGGFGREVLFFAKKLKSDRWDEFIFVDDVIAERVVCETRVLRWEEVLSINDRVEFIIANGEPAYREMLYNRIKGAGYSCATLISPWATVDYGSVVGEGSIIMDCGISVNVNIGANTVVNTQVTVGHDTTIGNHCMIGAKSFCGGGVNIGDRNYVSPGTLINDRINIGDDVIVGLGSVVVRNVKSSSIMFGNPAKKIGVNAEKRVWGRFK